MSKGLKGSVALGLPPGLTSLLTAPLVSAFSRAAPDGRLSISEGLSSAMLDALVRGNLDVAVVYDTAAPPEVELAPLFEQALYHVSGNPELVDKGSISLEDIANQPLVIPRRPNSIRMRVESGLAALGLKPRIAFEVDTIPGLLDLVANGVGDAVLPKTSIDAWQRSRPIGVIPITHPGLTVKLFIATSSRRPAGPIQKHLVLMVQEILTKLIEDDGGHGGLEDHGNRDKVIPDTPP